MRRVLFVPADHAARVANPASHMHLNTCRDARRGNEHGQRPLTVPEAETRAGAQGWTRFSNLQPAERRRWKAAFKATKGQSDEKR